MDNETKLSREQIDRLLSDLKRADEGDTVDVDAFAKKHLSEKQAQALRQAMKNPSLIKSILASPQAQSLLEKLKGESGKNES